MRVPFTNFTFIALLGAMICSILMLPARADETPATNAPAQKTIAELMEGLQSKDWERYTNSIHSLTDVVTANQGKDMGRFAPLIEPLLSHVGYGGIGERESETAARILTMLGDVSLQQLLTALEAPDARLRWSTAEILTAMRPAKPTAATALLPLISDTDPYVRRICFECYGRLGAEAKEAVPMLQKAAVEDVEFVNRMYCNLALTRITGDTDPYLDRIAAYLKDDLPANRSLAMDLMGHYGEVAVKYIDQFLFFARAPEVGYRIHAVAELGVIGVKSDDVVAALIDILAHDTDREVRRAAASSLGNIGPAATKAIPMLAAILEQANNESHGNCTGWWVAAKAVGLIGGPEAIPVLEKAARNDDPDIRGTALAALNELKKAEQ